MKASEASRTHRERVSHFSEYIEGEAFKWYLTEIFSNVETWDDIKRAMQNRFATTDGDAFQCHIISGLTDGVPPDVELALAGLSFQTSSEWLAAAQRVETSLRRYYIKSSTSLQQTAAANINFSAASSAKRM
ncbi:hypothetical protein HPB50_001128 [Hyalomma asiaticum]|uniref:Uncharacterized protein n=1 Tax=Hyalomma asiaticum TaxID=266040 RepID=A0ACB7RZL1_HYAAI|nr:hypothetical protein HPB50_001128 [Hyalomma asiaticum]